MSLFTLYLISVLPGFSGLASGIGWFLITYFTIWFLGATLGDYDDYNEKTKGSRKRSLIINFKKWGVLSIIACFLFSALIPSEKQLYTIAGGYMATNTTGIDKLPDNIVKAANSWLEKIAETSEKK